MIVQTQRLNPELDIFKWSDFYIGVIGGLVPVILLKSTPFGSCGNNFCEGFAAPTFLLYVDPAIIIIGIVGLLFLTVCFYKRKPGISWGIIVAILLILLRIAF